MIIAPRGLFSGILPLFLEWPEWPKPCLRDAEMHCNGIKIRSGTQELMLGSPSSPPDKSSRQFVGGVSFQRLEEPSSFPYLAGSSQSYGDTCRAE